MLFHYSYFMEKSQKILCRIARCILITVHFYLSIVILCTLGRNFNPLLTVYICVLNLKLYLLNVNTFHNMFFQDCYFCAIYEVSLRPKLAWFFTKYAECILCFTLCL